MIEFFLAIFSTYVLTVWGITVLFILALLWEYNDWYLSTIIGAVAIYLIAHYNGYVLSDFKWYHIFVYLVIGVVWSIWRYKNFVEESRKLLQIKIDDDVKKYPTIRRPAAEVISDFKYNVGVYNNVNKILSWIINWPISLIENSLKDIFDILRKVIQDYLRTIYEYFLNKEANKLDLSKWETDEKE